MSILHHIAAKLNNRGVRIHKENQFKEAAQFYKEALCALNKAVSKDGSIVQITSSDGDQLSRWQSMIAKNNPTTGVTASAQTNLPTSFLEPVVVSIPGRDLESNQNEDCTVTSVIVLYNLGLVNFQLEAFRKAHQFLQMALTLSKGIDTVAQTLFLCINHLLALIEYVCGNKDNAMAILFEIIIIGGKFLGEKNVLLACTYSTIGQLLISDGWISDALAAFEKASLIFESLAIENAYSFCLQNANEICAAHAA